MNETVNSKAMSGTLGNTTMYNLQTKRTLPRDVIKWIQGLDLSYSVKDYRKDLSNGFLIAQIVSRYEPGKIPMHAFQNSNNQARRDNNWNLLTIFFSKQELRKVKIQQSEFAKIKADNDPKSEQLYEFICRLYSVCTKRHLPQAGQAAQLPPTQSKNPNLTASYLLKEDGLEKLQNSHISQNSNQQVQKAYEDRVPTRKMVPNVDSSSRIEGKGMKQEINRKMTSKKKSWEAKSQSFYEESNPYAQKYVFDFLNQILQQCLNQEQNLESGLKQLFERQQFKPTEVMMKNLHLSFTFVLRFFTSVKSSINQILTVMLKDLNEIWKFFHYFIRMLGYFPYESQEFGALLDLITTYAATANLNEKKKINKVFMESLIDALIGQAKGCTEWQKRQRIMSMIYDFSGRQLEDKKTVLFSLKEKLGSNSATYFLWLAVLVREEKASSGNPKLIQDFIYYAHQNFSSSNHQLRISSLKILFEVAKNGWISYIQRFFNQQANIKRSRFVTDAEAIYFLSNIYFCLLKSIIESNQYQTLVKGKNQGNANTIKVYNPDHERQTSEIKHKVHNISMTLASLYHNSAALSVRQIIAKEAVNFISESSPLMLILVYHLGSLRELDQFFRQQNLVYELKSTLITSQPTKIDIIRENANDLIAEFLRMHEDKRNANIPDNADLSASIKQQLPFIDFCLQHINIKKFNIQLWEAIGEKLCKTVAASLSDQKHAEAAWGILQKIYLIIFNYDMKMPNMSIWIADGIAQILQNYPQGNEITNQIRQFFKQQYKNSNLEQVKTCGQEVNEALQQKGLNKLILIE